MFVPLRLLVGLGNPGKSFAQTRHNVGERWLRAFADRFAIEFQDAPRFRALVGRGFVFERDVRLLVPLTFMNLSGESVGAVARYFNIEPAAILVVHDEVDFEPGVSKFKLGGGANGHNGLSNIISHLGGEQAFRRLRIGVGRPNDADAMVGHLTRTPMSKEDLIECTESSELSDDILEWVLAGDWQRAMTAFHTRPDVEDSA